MHKPPINSQEIPKDVNLAYAYFRDLKGEVARHHKNRLTKKIPWAEGFAYVKLHDRVGCWEVIKNYFSLKIAITNAKTEWDAIHHLQAKGLATVEPLAYGVVPALPMYQRSFLLTKALLPHIELDRWFLLNEAKPIKVRRNQIRALAKVVKQMHDSGLNHRDCYLCHFVLKTDVSTTENSPIYIMDLHRAQIRKIVPRRWLIKDLAGLAFSAMEIEMSEREMLLFIKSYLSLNSLKTIDWDFWNTVKNKAEKLFFKCHARKKVIQFPFHARLPACFASLEAIEQLFASGEGRYLKKGDTTTVLAYQGYVVKRYNINRLWTAIKRALRVSRARRSNHFSKKLAQIGINTPRVLAYYEKKRWGFLQESYLVMEQVRGDDALLRLANMSLAEKNDLKDRILCLSERLTKAKLSHGDMKLSNFILHPSGKLYVIDLDGMREHSFALTLERAHQKDVARLLRNF